MSRRPIGQVEDPDLHERGVAPRLHHRRRQAELERAEGDVVEDRRAEELHVGILEDEPDLAVEAEGVLPVGNRRHVAAESRHPARRRGGDPVEQLQERRLPAPVGAQEHDLLAPADLEVD